MLLTKNKFRMKKNVFFSLFMLVSVNLLSAQIVIFNPVKVEKEDIKQFLNVEINYSKKIAQNAVNNNKLVGWALMENTNIESDGYNFMWVNVYPDIESATNENTWWNDSEKVLGVKPDILFSDSSKYKYGKSFTYKMQMAIPNSGPAAYVILNFATPDNVDAVIASSEKYVMPHFKKKMDENGMVGWGMATKITPQGEEYSSIMFYDSYDNLTNVMKHLAGEGIIKGLPMDKIVKVDWEMRPVMKVISSTTAKK
ncbi:MAG: hypothetical protein ACI9JT_000106 [Polaribacter sp.]